MTGGFQSELPCTLYWYLSHPAGVEVYILCIYTVSIMSMYVCMYTLFREKISMVCVFTYIKF